MGDYSFSYRNTGSIAYLEGNKRAHINFDWRSPIWFAGPRNIRKWEAPHEDEVITDEKKTEILNRLYADLIELGHDPKHTVIAEEPSHKFIATNTGQLFSRSVLNAIMYSEGWRKTQVFYMMKGPFVTLSPRLIFDWRAPFENIRVPERKKSQIINWAFKKLLDQGYDSEFIVIDDNLAYLPSFEVDQIIRDLNQET